MIPRSRHLSLPRRRLAAAALLGACALLGFGWLAHLDLRQKISADLLDLLPAKERAPEIAIVRSLASEAEARVMFFVLTDPAGKPAPAGAARAFAAALTGQPGIAQALALDDPAPREALGRELFNRRFTLLFPLWLKEREAAFTAGGGAPEKFSSWLAIDAAAALNRFLSTPQAFAFEDALSSDPLLLLPGVAGRLKGGLALVAPAADAASGPSLVWARIAASPLGEEGQAPVFAAIQRAAASLRGEYPGISVADTGVNRIAAASKARIQHELSWLNALSLAAVLAVALVFIRSPHRALHLVPPVVLATLGAWVCVTAAFSRVHILVFVVGAMLTGIAIDYGFYLYMQAPARPDEGYAEKVRRLAKPLLSSCFTTVAGFALLVFSDLPLIRQLGVFVGAGLVCALGATLVYFSSLKNNFLEARSFSGAGAFRSGARRLIRRMLIALWLAALPGLFLLTWKDDVRELEVPSPAIQREAARIRALFGEHDEQTVYLTHGATLRDARESLARFDAWMLSAGGSRAGTLSLGDVVPTAEEHARAVRFVHGETGFPSQFRAALTAAGFDASGFDPFFDAYGIYARLAADSDLEEAVRSLQARLSGPLSLLVHSGPPLAWFVTLARRAPAAPPPPETQTVTASQLQSLNRIFARYRQSALWLSVTGLAIVGAGVLLTYGPRDGARIFAIPCGACLGLFGLFGWIGEPLNLFHLLGAFLGVCLTHNYSIFSATSAYRREPPPVSVRLSALTAAASFGALAFSGIPVVHALGETVALMVLAALLTIEFEHFAPLARKP